MKQIRMHPAAYRANHAFSATIATANRRPLLARSEAAEIALAALLDSVNRYGARVFAYCIMPDHVHLLANTGEGVDFTEFVNHFKQLGGYRLRRYLNDGTAIWQDRFYDHGLRSEEGLLEAARYIFNNPVRAGIVGKPEDYQFSGSLVWKDAPLSEAKATDLHLPRPRITDRV